GREPADFGSDARRVPNRIVEGPVLGAATFGSSRDRILLGRRLHARHWPIARRRNVRAGARRIASLYSAYAGNVSMENAGRTLGFLDRNSAARESCRWREDEVAPSARSDRPRFTDRLCECGKPASGPRDHAAERNGGARGTRRRT